MSFSRVRNGAAATLIIAFGILVSNWLYTSGPPSYEQSNQQVKRVQETPFIDGTAHDPVFVHYLVLIGFPTVCSAIGLGILERKPRDCPDMEIYRPEE